jgi:hypothetical protein
MKGREKRGSCVTLSVSLSPALECSWLSGRDGKKKVNKRIRGVGERKGDF